MPQATYPQVPNTARVDLLLEGNTGLDQVSMESSFYINNDVVTRTPGYFSGLGDYAANSWEDRIAPITNVNTSIVGYRVTELDNVIHPSVESAFGPTAGAVGSAASASPLTVCAVIQLIGEFGVEPKKSYVRMPGLDESQVASNYLTTAAQSDVAAAWQLFVNDIAGGYNAADAIVIVSVYNPGGSGATRYRDTGLVNNIQSALCRRRIGRAASRLE